VGIVIPSFELGSVSGEVWCADPVRRVGDS
jgi:hypothetical protein